MIMTTPRHQSTAPSRFSRGGFPREEKVVWGDDGAHCLQCGNRWNGFAQCDCLPQEVTPGRSPSRSRSRSPKTSVNRPELQMMAELLQSERVSEK